MTDEVKKKFKVVTLGCRTNQYESQAFHDQLIGAGFHPAEESEAAQLCIVNTCTVTESADSSSRHAISQLSRENPGAQIVVTGCLAERRPDVIKGLNGVTAVVSNQDKENLLSIIYPEIEFPEFSIKNFDSKERAFIKIQDGCNSFCTYCIIPYVRGRSRSRSLAEVLKEAEGLIQNGFKEIVLTGINIGDFDGGGHHEGQPIATLADLVRAIDALPGLERLRISSIDPDEVDDYLADAILNGAKTAPSMHIVLQSGSNVILKKMNRKYTRQQFLTTIDRLRQASPDFTFTTDVIVGFPGETDSDFEATLELIEQIQFAKVHMFPYSDRPRTRSALMPNKVPPQIIKERKQRLLRLAEKSAYELRQNFIGREMMILTEGKESLPPGMIFGHTSNFLPVMVPSTGLKPNQLVRVKITENSPLGLYGVCIV